MPDATDNLSQLFTELKLRSGPPGEYDVAEWNLILAQDLPGAENIDTDKLLGKLDDWADLVRAETQRLYHDFIESPWNYENSQGYFCVLVLVTVLERDLGVRYNPERVRDPKFQDPYCVDPDFSDSRDIFIHGILDGPGGTCSSMPVVYTAVGRRLGYPMKLVHAPEHLFSRWDDPEGKFNGVPDCFNIDASGHGFSSHPDEHYKSWPREWTEQEEELGIYLKSQSQEAEIAGFLSTRGACLEDNNRLGEAFRCFHWAYQLTQDKRYYQEAAKLQHRLEEQSRRLLESIEDREKMRREGPQKIYQPVVKRWVAPHAAGNNSNGRPAINAMHGPSCQCMACNNDRQAANKPANNNGFPQPHFPGPHFP